MEQYWMTFQFFFRGMMLMLHDVIWNLEILNYIESTCIWLYIYGQLICHVLYACMSCAFVKTNLGKYLPPTHRHAYIGSIWNISDNHDSVHDQL